MKTTLVIPHYNDASRLGPFLEELCRELPGHFEVLVSDNGSRPYEREALRRVLREAQSSGGGEARILDPLFTGKIQARAGR